MKTFDERFWEKVNKKGEDECWEWIGYKTEKRYGQMWLKGRGSFLSHRASWMIRFGEIPEGFCVCHSCDNPSCVNPSHLFLGTNDDNVADRENKGRGIVPKGEQNGNSKLTEEDVICIMARLLVGKESKASIARSFRVSHKLIGLIWNMEVWKHLWG